MNKTIEKYLTKRGVYPNPRSEQNSTFSERNAVFFKWFEESVMKFDSEEYYREFWREARQHGHVIGHKPVTFRNHHRSVSPRMYGGLFLAELFLCGGAFVIWFVRRMIDQHLQQLRRPTYYEVERARRHALTEERRKIHKRRTTNAIPDKKLLLSAFAKAKDSPENMIRFGSLIEDLECYVDNSPYFKNGRLVGRRGGIRRYLQSEIPELYTRYKTVMRYKSLSKKFRQAVGVSDPIPATALLIWDKKEKEMKNDGNGRRNAKRDVRELISDENPTREIKLREKGDEIVSRRAIEVAMEIFEGCEGSVVSLEAQLAIRLSADYVPNCQEHVSAEADASMQRMTSMRKGG